MNREHESAQIGQAEHFTNACNQIHESLEIPSIMRATVSSALNLVDAEIGATGLLIDGQMAFSEHCSSGKWMPLKHRFNVGKGVIGHIIKHGRPYLSNDPAQEPRINPEIDSELGGVRQLIAIPIYGKQDGAVGCLLVFNRQSGPFTEADQTILEQLASIASSAIDNAIQISESRRIEEDLQKSVATYKTLVEQIPAITYIATLDRSSILFVSPQIESILGYSQDDFLSKADMCKISFTRKIASVFFLKSATAIPQANPSTRNIASLIIMVMSYGSRMPQLLCGTTIRPSICRV